jgi:hypothetical protein
MPSRGLDSSGVSAHLGTKVMLAIAFLAIATIVVREIVIRQKAKEHSKKQNSNKQRLPGMPKGTEMDALPPPKIGGQRKLDDFVLSPEAKEKRLEAKKMIQKGEVSQGALILESIDLQREAIDVLESHGLLDDAAAILMRMNRPNRAAVIYERNNKFEQAAIYFLKAKLVDDSKRCCRRIKNYSPELSLDLSHHFAEAGDFRSAFRLLGEIKDTTSLLKIAREKYAFRDLALFLDYPAARKLLLSELSATDFKHMLQYIPEDETSLFSRPALWINEGKKADWLTEVFTAIGDKRGDATKFAEMIDESICDLYGSFVSGATLKDVEKNHRSFAWAARAFHDLLRMNAAALVYQKINIPLLAGKCWALAGCASKALAALNSQNGDQHLASQYQQELQRMGLGVVDKHQLEKHEQDTLTRLFFNIDPDTENNRAASPFSLAS